MVLNLLQGIGELASNSISNLLTPEPTHRYTASFERVSKHLSRWNKGICLDGSHGLSRLVSAQNQIILSPTGGGKTSICIIPSIFFLAKGKSSMVINDPSGGELYLKTSGYLAKRGYTILRIDFSNPSISERWNYLLECNSQSEIEQTAFMLIKNSPIGNSSNDPFWEHAAIRVCAILIRFSVFHAPVEERNLGHVLRLIQLMITNAEEVDRRFLSTNDTALIQSYKTIVGMGERVLQNVLTTLLVALNVFSDPQVAEITSKSSFSAKILHEKPVALYIATSITKLEYFKCVTALLFQNLFNFCLSSSLENKPRYTHFILEESGIYTFPQLGTTISNIRKFSGGITLCMQDENALNRYGISESKVIKTNCWTKIYLKNTPLESARSLSQLLGKVTFIDQFNREHTKELMSIDEINRCTDAIVTIGADAIRCRVTPYYRHLVFRRYAKIPPYAPNREQHISSPPQ
jgi:type IV secretion system protein VirD4